MKIKKGEMNWINIWDKVYICNDIRNYIEFTKESDFSNELDIKYFWTFKPKEFIIDVVNDDWIVIYNETTWEMLEKESWIVWNTLEEATNISKIENLKMIEQLKNYLLI